MKTVKIEFSQYEAAAAHALIRRGITDMTPACDKEMANLLSAGEIAAQKLIESCLVETTDG